MASGVVSPAVCPAGTLFHTMMPMVHSAHVFGRIHHPQHRNASGTEKAHHKDSSDGEEQGVEYRGVVPDRAFTDRGHSAIGRDDAERAEEQLDDVPRGGAERLDIVTRPIDAAHVSTDIAAVPKPALTAPAVLWAKYHKQLAALYCRQAANCDP